MALLSMIMKSICEVGDIDLRDLLFDSTLWVVLFCGPDIGCSISTTFFQ